MKKRVLLIAAAVTVAAILASVPFAFARGGFRGRGAHDDGATFFGRLGHLKSELNLTDQQASDIKAVFQSLRAQNAPYREQLKGGMQAVAQSLLNNPNDLAAAQALIDQQAAVERTMKANALAAASKALNVLTPEQRGKLKELAADRMARRSMR
jgi:Spy/CpxP family protein refolding chaperone